ncbi:nuclear transport factor 2 family protein [Nocardioides sp. QY071]|uniref:nuclear transport factor 2 family protein n=1 Tax=Nocardioides sp. QY071 TaxID=3044187 RepID=UPI00249B977A|nr:nuclear transport factor 2 family protein [Nocardioides sp. QY071]WGY00387.1 nuclear transport factor 2 family protein [Nocardioides sp. QY071]
MTQQRSANEIAELLLHLGSGAEEADPAAFDAVLADDITWELMGGEGLDYARTYRGKAEVYKEYMGKLQAKIDHARSTTSTVEVMADDARGMVAVRNHDDLALHDGGRLEVDVLLLMRVAEGKVVSIREFMDLRPVEAAFGTSLG